MKRKILGACLLAAALLMVALLATPGTATQPASCNEASQADFNGDQRDDVVVGDPGTTIGDVAGAGSVTVLSGTGTLGKETVTTVTAEEPKAGDGFGYAVATGLINNDKCLDMVVGAPWAEEGEGRAYIYLGSPEGLKFADVIEPDDEAKRFGWSVALAPKKGGEPSAVAIGAPYTAVDEKAAAGSVHWFDFDESGEPKDQQVLTQDDDRAEGSAEAGDMFGWAVALGSIRGDKDAHDLIVSEPYEDVDGQAVDAGSFSVVEDVRKQGDAKGEHWHYNNLKIGSPTEGGRIGWSLDYAEENGTAYVAIGAPGQAVNGRDDSGAVALLRSTGTGLSVEPAVKPEGFAEQGDRYGWSVALANGAVTGNGFYLAVGVPYDGADNTKENGWVHLLSLKDRSDTRLIDALNKDLPGDAGDNDHFGWSVAFSTGTLLIGVPNDRQNPTGSLVFKPIDKNVTPVRFRPETSFDHADFGGALASGG